MDENTQYKFFARKQVEEYEIAKRDFFIAAENIEKEILQQSDSTLDQENLIIANQKKLIEKEKRIYQQEISNNDFSKGLGAEIKKLEEKLTNTKKKLKIAKSKNTKMLRSYDRTIEETLKRYKYLSERNNAILSETQQLKEYKTNNQVNQLKEKQDDVRTWSETKKNVEQRYNNQANNTNIYEEMIEKLKEENEQSRNNIERIIEDNEEIRKSDMLLSNQISKLERKYPELKDGYIPERQVATVVSSEQDTKKKKYLELEIKYNDVIKSNEAYNKKFSMDEVKLKENEQIILELIRNIRRG